MSRPSLASISPRRWPTLAGIVAASGAAWLFSFRESEPASPATRRSPSIRSGATKPLASSIPRGEDDYTNDARQFPASSVSSAAPLPDVEAEERRLIAQTEAWARRDPAAAAFWATQLSEAQARTKVVASLTALWAETAPLDAAQFALSLPAGDHARREAVRSAFAGWARRDGRAAADRAVRLFPAELRDEALEQVMCAWAQTSAAAAAEWLLALPDNTTRDRATSALSGSLVDRNPAIAFELATGIRDAALRARRLENIVSRWRSRDRQAVEAALASASTDPVREVR